MDVVEVEVETVCKRLNISANGFARGSRVSGADMVVEAEEEGALVALVML